MRKGLGLTFALALVLAACGGDSKTETASPSSTTAAPTTVAPSTTAVTPTPSTTTAAATTTKAPATTVAPTTTAAPATTTAQRPVLKGNGLGVVNFGASKADTIAALNKALGMTGQDGDAGCPQWGPNSSVVSYQNLRANIMGGVFRGWSYGRPLPSLNLKTVAGIGEGIDVAAAKAVYGAANVTSPGLPINFGSSIKLTTPDGDIYVKTSADGDAGKLVDFNAGQFGCE